MREPVPEDEGGLTFGTISAPFGPNAGIIDGRQFSLLVTWSLLAAVVRTAIAERWFLPNPSRIATTSAATAPASTSRSS